MKAFREIVTLIADDVHQHIRLKRLEDSHTFTLPHMCYISKERQGRKGDFNFLWNFFGGNTEMDNHTDETLLPIVHPDLIPFLMILQTLNQGFFFFFFFN